MLYDRLKKKAKQTAFSATVQAMNSCGHPSIYANRSCVICQPKHRSDLCCMCGLFFTPLYLIKCSYTLSLQTQGFKNVHVYPLRFHQIRNISIIGLELTVIIGVSNVATVRVDPGHVGTLFLAIVLARASFMFANDYVKVVTIKKTTPIRS